MQNIPVFIKKEKINKLVKKLAEEIVKNNKDKQELNLITVLIGAKTFAQDLIKEILSIKEFRINNYEVRLSSYKDSKSTGKINIVKDVEYVENKELIIIEDIVDTGLTLSFFKKYLLEEKKADSVKICSLLSKPSRRKADIDIDYLGAEVPDKFIVGYGLDYNQKYRELPYIGVLNES